VAKEVYFRVVGVISDPAINLLSGLKPKERRGHRALKLKCVGIGAVSEIESYTGQQCH
jgi:hypothetical protein